MNNLEVISFFCKKNNLIFNYWIDDKRQRDVGRNGRIRPIEIEEIVFYFQIKKGGKSIFEYGVILEDNHDVLKEIPILGTLTEDQQKKYYDKYNRIGVDKVLLQYFIQELKGIILNKY